MTFLIGLLTPILEWCIQKLATWGVVEIETIIAKMKQEAQAKTDAAALSAAKTSDEQKAALQNIVNDTFPNP